ncbi:hypothetical protein DFH94DRAFT_324276 [Russula ochroleuca]|uniref:Uncharacterized protein n=1 Tax=Russula ochroleuca TaxID=152965 RepID=A0A9P5TBI1_9AGAM|nr:hypothetical protein DFH94DRAFT_324276 [Russula ochroleuca]
MRSTTVVSLLVASWALLSQSPAAYAAPAPSNVVSAAEKRQCQAGACKFATSPDTDTTSQSEVQGLVSVLINALETYQAQNTPSTFNSTLDFTTPEDTGAEPELVVDVIELADAGL